MAAKFTAMYPTPDDPAAFDEHYFGHHMKIVERWPNVQRAEVAKVTGAPGGRPSEWYLTAEIWFADMAALEEALSSEAGMEAGQDARGFAPKGTTMFVSEVQ